DDSFGVAWPLGVTALATAAALLGPAGVYRIVAAAAAYPLVALAPMIVAFIEYDRIAYLQLAVGVDLVVIAAAFRHPSLTKEPARQLLTILAALVPATFTPFVLCLVKCADQDGMQLLGDALSNA